MERPEQIYAEIVRCPGTERELAERVGLKKTPYTRWILQALMHAGHITRTWEENRQPRPAYVYYVQNTLEMEL